MIFRAYKWDPQVEDYSTVLRRVVLIDRKTALQLELWAEQLAEETMRMEQVLIYRPDLARELGLPKKYSECCLCLQTTGPTGMSG